jgi:hypothetical protein
VTRDRPGLYIGGSLVATAPMVIASAPVWVPLCLPVLAAAAGGVAMTPGLLVLGAVGKALGTR